MILSTIGQVRLAKINHAYDLIGMFKMVIARFDRIDHFICFCKILHVLVLSCSQDDTRCILSCNILPSQSKYGKILQDLSKNFY